MSINTKNVLIIGNELALFFLNKIVSDYKMSLKGRGDSTRLSSFIKFSYKEGDGLSEYFAIDGLTNNEYFLEIILCLCKQLNIKISFSIGLFHVALERILEKIIEDVNLLGSSEHKRDLLIDDSVKVIEDFIKFRNIYEKNKNYKIDKTFLFKNKFLINYVPESIEIRFNLKKEDIDVIESYIKKIISDFKNDFHKFPEELLFHQQAKNFSNFLIKNGFYLGNKPIVFPFDIIKEEKFDFIRILNFLETKNYIEEIDWDYMDQKGSIVIHTKDNFEKNFLNLYLDEEDEDSLKIDGKKGQIAFCLKTGDFIFNNLKGNLLINSHQYKFFEHLFLSEKNQSAYENLIKKIWKVKTDNSTNRRELSDVLKKIKKSLNILPKGKNSKPDIFENMRGYGYKINMD